MHDELSIVETNREGKRNGKSYRFTATLLGWLEANTLWELGGGAARRPVWIAYAAASGASRAFTANFRGGRRIERAGYRGVEQQLEIPKSSPHRWVSQDVGGGVIVTTAYLPELFHLEPVRPPDRVRFIMMPSCAWVTSQAARLPEFGEEAPEAVKAALFCAYLDRRTGLPILQDLRFQLRLYRAALETIRLRDSGTRRGVLEIHGVGSCGLEAPVVIDALHEQVEVLLKEQVQKFYEEEVRTATPVAVPAIQLSLDFSEVA